MIYMSFTLLAQLTLSLTKNGQTLWLAESYILTNTTPTNLPKLIAP
jgi:hypothetical protein